MIPKKKKLFIYREDRFTANRQIKNVYYFDFHSVPFQLFQPHKIYIDVFEINSPFIVTHNKCIINVTPNVIVC